MKLAIITGGSRGLGRAILENYTLRGWKVIELSRSGSGEDHLDIDMGEPTIFIEIFREILNGIDLDILEEVALISNAGTLSPISKVNGLSSEEMLHSFNINISSALLMIQVFVNFFRRFTGKKSVVSISSGAATKGYPGWSLYCAGKAACENFMRTLFMEEQDESTPFQVISFNPGVMDTVMQKEIRHADPEQFPMQRRFLNLKESGDLRAPEHVAEKLVTVIESKYIHNEFIYSVNS